MIMINNFIFMLLALFVPMLSQDGFRQNQLKYPRVKEAFQQKEQMLTKLLSSKNIRSNELEIFIRILKSEKTVEVWGKNKPDSKFVFVCQYTFCASSGNPGPKRTQGDHQTPEGFYHIERFNPQSSFHLSLGINYPNKSDKILYRSGNPGGDIFIHGNCVTIGCIPITDDKIKELYVLCVIAKNNGQVNIPVHIFPARLDDKNAGLLFAEYEKNTALVLFWKELKPVYDYFDKNSNLPSVKIDSKGSYSL
jgi:murein L,D-transpeptidase YafK